MFPRVIQICFDLTFLYEWKRDTHTDFIHCGFCGTEEF